MLVGVIIDEYGKVKEESSGRSVLLTPQQNQWVQTQRLLLSASLTLRYVRPAGGAGPWARLRQLCFDVGTAKWFDATIIGVILANMARRPPAPLFVSCPLFLAFATHAPSACCRCRSRHVCRRAATPLTPSFFTHNRLSQPPPKFKTIQNHSKIKTTKKTDAHGDGARQHGARLRGRHDLARFSGGGLGGVGGLRGL